MTIANPYRPLNLAEFDTKNSLPQIESVAIKIHKDTVFEANMREKLLRAKERTEAADDDVDPGEGGSRAKKRGFMSPLNNADKKSKIDDKNVKSIIDRILPKPQVANDVSDDDLSDE